MEHKSRRVGCSRGGFAGRTRIRLAKLLSDKLGYEVSPYDLWYQEGSNRWADGARWGFTVSKPCFVSPCPGTQVACWDTMTVCVRHGIGIYKDPWDEWTVYATVPKSVSKN